MQTGNEGLLMLLYSLCNHAGGIFEVKVPDLNLLTNIKNKNKNKTFVRFHDLVFQIILVCAA